MYLKELADYGRMTTPAERMVTGGNAVRSGVQETGKESLGV